MLWNAESGAGKAQQFPRAEMSREEYDAAPLLSGTLEMLAADEIDVTTQALRRRTKELAELAELPTEIDERSPQRLLPRFAIRGRESQLQVALARPTQSPRQMIGSQPQASAAANGQRARQRSERGEQRARRPVFQSDSSCTFLAHLFGVETMRRADSRLTFSASEQCNAQIPATATALAAPTLR